MKRLRPRTVADAPPSVWGEEDEFYYGVHPDMKHGPKPPIYSPINKQLPVSPPDRVLDGFSLFPERKRRDPDPARSAAADRVLQKFGVTPAWRALRRIGLR